VTGFFLVALVSYLIGSIPAGYLIAKLARVDIRQQGSGNIGATNVTRVLGKAYGYPVFLADFSKGLSAVLLAPVIGRACGLTQSPELFQIMAGVCVVLGNAFPVWLRFRGGKGVATSSGMLFGLMASAAFVCIVVWVVMFYATRYVSLASITAAVALPVAVFVITRVTESPRPLVLYASAGLALIVILRHRSNVSRLMRGTEERVKRRED
jgi:glycerol-3-phosphate acyltransferase PlsY